MESNTSLPLSERVGLKFSVSLSLPGSSSSRQWRKPWSSKNNVIPMVPIIAPFAEGHIEPGSCVAIMGSSGSGKTSLLNCLALRVSSGGRGARGRHVLGTRNPSQSSAVEVNGTTATSDLLAQFSGFVHQEDLFLSNLTPREHLEFVTALSVDFRFGSAHSPPNRSAGARNERLGEPSSNGEHGHQDETHESNTPVERGSGEKVVRSRSEQLEARKALVDATLADFGLTKCADVLIGGGISNTKGISGGERKRLSTASACVRRPPLLFLDEPTSGLDSHIAHEVVELLAGLASKGHTVVSSVHQPGSDTFALFSHICLLTTGSAGARIAYFGLRSEAPAFFSSQGHHIPEYFNPADFYIRCLAKLQKSEGDESESASTTALCDAFDAMRIQRDEIDEGAPSREVRGLPSSLSFAGFSVSSPTARSARLRGFRPSFSANNSLQFRELFTRARLSVLRDPILTKARVGQAVVMALIGGSMYAYSAGDKTNQVQNVMGSTFFMVFNQGVSGLLGVLQVFPLEVPLLVREVSSKRFRVHNYVLARMLAELPLQLLCPVLFGSIMFFVARVRPVKGQVDAWRFFLVLVSLVLTSNASVSMGYAIGGVSRNPQMALVLGPALLLPLVIFGGLLLNSDDVPPYWLWLEPLSFVKYGYHAVSYFVWTERELTREASLGSGFQDGEAVLDYLSVGDGEWPLNLGALLALFVGWRLVAYTFLLRRCSVELGSGM